MERIIVRVRKELMHQFKNYGIRSSMDPPPELDPSMPLTGK